MADLICVIIILSPEPVPNSTQTEGREIPAPCTGSVSLTLIYLCTKCNCFTKEKSMSTHVRATQVKGEVGIDK